MLIILHIYLCNAFIIIFQSKRDAMQRTGNGGGREKQYTAINLKVLAILGEESPLVKGTDVSESTNQFKNVPQSSQIFSANTLENKNNSTNMTSTENQMFAAIQQSSQNLQSSYDTNNSNSGNLLFSRCKRKEIIQIDELKRKNLELEVEIKESTLDLINLKKRKLQLQIEELSKNKSTANIQWDPNSSYSFLRDLSDNL